jgi:hypothetical protein
MEDAMSRKEVLPDVLEHEVDEIVDDFESEGATVEKTKQANGLWTLTATFPSQTPADETNTWYPFSYEESEEEGESRHAPAPPSYDVELGKLSEKYESNGYPGAIGHDNTGGFSYGKYQIATKTGTMKKYMNFLKEEFPAFEQELSATGGLDSALNGTVEFKRVWKKLAKNPNFADSQHAFIQKTHYEPFVERLKGIGLDVNARSRALKNVVWSVSVQHGPGNNVFRNALRNYDPNDLEDNQKVSDKEIVEAVYAERSKVDVYFKNSALLRIS